MQKARLPLFVALALTGFAARGSAQDPYRQTVVVTAAATPATLETTARPLRVIGREELAALPVASVADALRVVGAVDVRARGPRGTQTDFAVRGGGFGQTLVLIDGIRLNDPQSGHHNGDIPVPLDAVERIEVLAGPGSSLFGADAFGGTINIVTRTPGRGARVAAHGGTFGTAGIDAGVAGRAGPLAQRLDVTFDRSDGFVADRDFRSTVVSSRTTVGEDSSVALSFLHREFGAYNFYGGGVPSREWTNGLLLSGSHRRRVRAWQIALDGAYRTHGDRFVFDRRTPALSDNRHRTHTPSGRAIASRTVAAATVAAGVEVAGDWIVSSALGDHQVTHAAAFTEWRQRVGSAVQVSGSLRVDRYTTFGSAWNPSAAVAWWATPGLRLRASGGRAFRVPTFTERFYRDPVHLARPDIGPERAWAGEGGLDLFREGWSASVTAFGRADRDLIDWLRTTPADRWATANIRTAATRGVELGLRRAVGRTGFLTAEYVALQQEAPTVAAFSKYALDYARQSFVAAAAVGAPLGLRVAPRVEYRQRVRSGGEDNDLLLDLRVARRVGDLLEVAVDGTNLLDREYQEVPGVPMPSRALLVALRIGRR